MKQAISINVNGVDHHDEVEPRLLLVHYLRDLLGLTGTHIGCETSICGACTVLLDGQAVKSCTVFAIQILRATRFGMGWKAICVVAPVINISSRLWNTRLRRRERS